MIHSLELLRQARPYRRRRWSRLGADYGECDPEQDFAAAAECLQEVDDHPADPSAWARARQAFSAAYASASDVATSAAAAASRAATAAAADAHEAAAAAAAEVARRLAAAWELAATAPQRTAHALHGAWSELLFGSPTAPLFQIGGVVLLALGLLIGGVVAVAWSPALPAAARAAPLLMV